MATYYVGIGGNDGNSGLTWALRKLTLNGAEDVPVVAGDTVYVGPGVYREQLTVDVSGGAGSPIVYIGDVTGEHTDGVGGVVRITGSNDDTTAARQHWITGDGIDYRTFRGFRFDTSFHYGIELAWDNDYWIIEDCSFASAGAANITIASCETAQNITIRRCLFWLSNGAHIEVNGTDDITDMLVENCIFLPTGKWAACVEFDYGGATVRNCLFTGCYRGVYSVISPSAVPIVVNNCLFHGCILAIVAVANGDVVEDYNLFWRNATDRQNTDTGIHSVAHPTLMELPIFHSGSDQVSGYKFPWWVGELSEWSHVRAIQGAGQAQVDLHGIERPFPQNRRSWGPIQHMDTERETGTVHAGSASIAFHRPARRQFFVPCTATSTTVSVYVYREAGYLSDRNPGMILKQPGASDRVTRDAGLAAQWNQISDTFTPNADPPWFVVELANESYYSTSTSTTSSSTSTTVTLPTQSTSTSTTVSTSTSTTLPTLSTSTSTTSISTSTTTLDVFFDDLVVS